MASLKDKLSALDRKRVPMNIKSLDGQREVECTYQRPTEIVDTVLRQALSDEYDDAVKKFRAPQEDGKPSIFESLVTMFNEKDAEIPANYLVFAERDQIRAEAKRLVGVDPPADDATTEAKEQYEKDLSEAIQSEVDRRLERYKADPLEKIAQRAAEVKLSEIAMERAYQIYRRSLVAQSIYEVETNEAGEALSPPKYKLAFASQEEVAEYLPSETIDSLANRAVEELNKARALPLK